MDSSFGGGLKPKQVKYRIGYPLPNPFFILLNKQRGMLLCDMLHCGPKDLRFFDVLGVSVVCTSRSLKLIATGLISSIEDFIQLRMFEIVIEDFCNLLTVVFETTP